ncbi:MAG: DNA topoisomerase IB [Verrucomicrobiaceae bacterium]|nr:DNA topoisomerase IB [Verrucomicrobiaceae bacterium]
MAATATLEAEAAKVAETIVSDPKEAAEEVGLRYVSDEQPGYTRKQKGDDFEYCDTKGELITDEARILRIKRIGIPPAWTDVWICPSQNGHLQATVRDARRRKQYRYHEKFREFRDEAKYEKMLVFGAALPKIRERVEADLALAGLPKNKVLATLVSIMERTFIRVGNEEYAKQNNSYGLTTMKNKHATVKGTKVSFAFRGKSGVEHAVAIADKRLARIVKKVQDLPGQELFGYIGDDDEVQDVKSQDVNEYLREITGEDFTAKDFRTWAGTVLAAVALNALDPCETKKEMKKNVTTAVKAVAKILGNTPAVCRKCYVHPAVLEAYLSGGMIEGLRRKTAEALEAKTQDLQTVEVAVMQFLQARLAEVKKAS